VLRFVLLGPYRKEITMKKKDIQVGGKYTALVSGTVQTVRIDGESAFGGWTATNLATGRQVRIRSAQRLRSKVVAEVRHDR
jgi:hypothetical protein